MKKLIGLISIFTALSSFASAVEYDISELTTALAGAGITGPDFKKDKINEGMDKFADEILVAAPQASTQQNVWADAYIGQLLKLPPHLGFGISAGGTLINMEGLKNAASAFGESLSSFGAGNIDFGKIPDKFFLPSVTFDIRLGGIILPFDIGLCAMMTNPSLTDISFNDPESFLNANHSWEFGKLGFSGSADYVTLGADFRYRILEEKLIVPSLSLGLGYVYTRGNFGVSASEKNTSAHINMSYSTHVLYMQAQCSKEILFMTLFGGGRALLSNTSTSWAWDVSGTFDTGSPLGEVTLKDSSASETENGSYRDGKFDFSNIQPQLFAGIGFNFFVFQTNLSLCTDVRSLFDSGNYENALISGALSFHFKL